MPEGDTLFRTARTLHRALAGRRVERFESAFPALARVDQDRPLAGRTVEAVESAGKHLLIRFSGGLVLRTHLRMRGSWHIYRTGERWMRPRSDMRVVVATAGFEAVAFTVPVAEFLQVAALARQPDLAAMGPDLLSADFDAAEAVRRVRARGEEPVEAALLNQRVLAGIGNVFKSEVLFATRVHPFAPVSSLADATLAAIVAKARELLAANARPDAPGRIVTCAGHRRTTRRGAPGEDLWVYARGGRPCRECGTPIAARRSGPHARWTWWCPSCQSAPPPPTR
jgi:endonuclease-8